MLNKKDAKLLLELDINSRQSYNQIAKKVNSSAQAVKYKVNSFIKAGLIKQFYAIINLKQLGFSGYYKLYIRLKNADQKKQDDIIDKLKENDSIIWIASCGGRWDISLAIFSKDMTDFNEKLLKIKKEFEKHIKDLQIISVTDFFHFPRSYLTNQKSEMEFPFSVISNQKYKLDKKDIQILSMLTKNSRVSVLDMAELTNLSSNAVSQRIKKLIKNKIISQFSILLDTKKLGYYASKILIKLHETSEQELKQFKHYCRTHPNIVFYSKCFGEWNCEVEAEIQNREEFHNIILDIRNKFPNLIENYDFIDFFKEYKYDFFPKAIRTPLS